MIMITKVLQRIHFSTTSVARLSWTGLKLPSRPHQLRMASTFPDPPIFRAIASHDPESTAIVHSKSNRRFTYGDLLRDVEDAKIKLYRQLKIASPGPVGGQRVAFLVENGYDYVGAKYMCFTG